MTTSYICHLSSFVAQTQGGKKKYSGRLLISASATVGALLLVALMCFWGCDLYKKFGKNDSRSLAIDVSGGASSLATLAATLPIKKRRELSENILVIMFIQVHRL